MTVDRWINLLVTLTLIEMMVAIGLAVAVADLIAICKQWRLIILAALANYLLVPAATFALLWRFDAKPMVAAGFLILAVCPGAPYGPACTSIAKGNVGRAVGLMFMLASSSAVVAPLLLRLLLPIVSGDAEMHVDAARLVATLLLTQLLPLSAGIGLRAWRPVLAARMSSPANRLSTLLNVAAITFILASQFRVFLEIRPAAYGGMAVLLFASLAAGWLLGGVSHEGRRTMALTTSLRNVGVAMVIAAGSFPGTAALTAVLAYATVELLGSLAIAAWWGRRNMLQSASRATPTRTHSAIEL